MSKARRCIGRPFCWVITVAVWTQFVAASAVWSLHSINAHTDETVINRGRDLFRLIQYTRRWNASHGGIYVVKSAAAPSNPYLDAANKDVKTLEGLELTMLNPAYMARQISEMAREEGFYFHVTSAKPMRPANAPDAWERRALESFERGQEERLDLVRSDNHQVYRYMAPLLVTTSCLKCHAEQGYAVGDIRGGISVNIEADEIVARRNHEMLMIGGTHLTVWMAVSVVIFLLMRDMRRQFVSMDDDLAAYRRSIDENREALRAANRKIHALQHEDQVTGLLGREQLERRLQEALDKAEANHRSMGLVLIEIDHFQAFNQRNGAIEGDAALRLIADKLREVVAKRRALVGRYLGGTFAIALGADDTGALAIFAKDMQDAVRTLGIRHEVDKERFLTIGVATLLVSGSQLPDATELLRNAVARLKARGAQGNQIISLG